MNPRVQEALEQHPKRIVAGKICPLVFSANDGRQLVDIKKGGAGAKKRAGMFGSTTYGIPSRPI